MIADLKPYPTMKESGVTWLGMVPSHWELVPNRALLKLKKESVGGKSPEYLLLSLTKRGVIARDMENPEGKFPASFDTYQVVEPGNLIFCLFDIDETPRAVGLSSLHGMITSAYTRFVCSDDSARRFIYLLYLALDDSKCLKPLYTGLRKVITKSAFLSAKIALPPPEERNDIVRFLDAADRRIRNAIRAKQKLIKLLEEQKQAIIHRAVTRGLRPDVRLKPSCVEWLGDVPEHWEVKRAKALCLAIVDCKNRTPDTVEAGAYTVVRTTCVRHGRFDPSGGYMTDLKNFTTWTGRGAPQLGDVFFTREAPAGEACLVPDRNDLCMGQRMMYFRPDPDLLDSRFMLLSIYGPFTSTYIQLATNGSTVGHLRLGQVNALPILWCPIDEQQRIINYVESETAPLNETIATAGREMLLLREYRTRLIADVVTGKLDVREAAARLPDTIESIDAAPDDDIAIEGDEEAAESLADTDAEGIAA